MTISKAQRNEWIKAASATAAQLASDQQLVNDAMEAVKSLLSVLANYECTLGNGVRQASKVVANPLAENQRQLEAHARHREAQAKRSVRKARMRALRAIEAMEVALTPDDLREPQPEQPIGEQYQPIAKPANAEERLAYASDDARKLFGIMIAAFTGDVNEAIADSRKAAAETPDTGWGADSWTDAIHTWSRVRLDAAHAELIAYGVLSPDAPRLDPSYGDASFTHDEFEAAIDATLGPTDANAELHASREAQREAVIVGLALALAAPDNVRAQHAAQVAESLATNLSDVEIAACKREALARAEQVPHSGSGRMTIEIEIDDEETLANFTEAKERQLLRMFQDVFDRAWPYAATGTLGVRSVTVKGGAK
jgi:hypothetical protein